jgi:hypothetical protein
MVKAPQHPHACRLHLAVSILPLYGKELLLVLPLVIPMGWTESPPHFCAVTETVADLTNK